jgi:hypothetical protein
MQRSDTPLIEKEVATQPTCKKVDAGSQGQVNQRAYGRWREQSGKSVTWLNVRIAKWDHLLRKRRFGRRFTYAVASVVGCAESKTLSTLQCSKIISET